MRRKRRVRGVLLCEDSQHEAFALRFLRKAGWDRRGLRVVMAPPGKGSAAAFVQRQFPLELGESRRRHSAKSLVVMVDGDERGLRGRLEDLARACRAQGVASWQEDGGAYVFVPTRSIESWLAYLDGALDVDETKAYPRLERAGECQRHVEVLHRMCDRSQLRQPAPPSLEHACEEYRRFRQQNA